jgi:predicted nucleic acid-binding protein
VSVGLVVDTSVWIAFSRGESAPLLEDALALGSVVLSPLVLAELVSGARGDADRARLVDMLDDLPLHETARDHWIRVGASPDAGTERRGGIDPGRARGAVRAGPGCTTAIP